MECASWSLTVGALGPYERGLMGGLRGAGTKDTEIPERQRIPTCERRVLLQEAKEVGLSSE